jgi:RNA polymerase sigma-70 factor (ECF subfamily)
VSDDKISEGHAEELAECFAVFASRLFGYACVLTHEDRALSDDLVQATFMAAARQWSTLRSYTDARRFGWLRTTIGYLAISAFRRNKAFRDRLEQLEAKYRPPVADTDAEALSAIALERCLKAIKTLPPQQHIIAEMRWLQAMNSTEIAEQLGLARGTVAAQLYTVRRKLKADLGPYDPFGEDEGGASS